MPFSASHRFSGPLHAQVAILLEKQIVEGKWSVSQPLPGEHELAIRFKVSVGTMRRALMTLVRRGLITRQRGRGTIVVQSTPSSLNIVASRVGGTPNYINFSARIAEADDAIAKGLGLGPGSRVVVGERLLGLDDGSRILGTIFWPAAMCTGLSNLDEISLDDWEREYQRLGISLGNCSESVTSIAAPDQVASALEIPAESPILRLTRIVASEGGIIEYAVGYCWLKEIELQFKS